MLPGGSGRRVRPGLPAGSGVALKPAAPALAAGGGGDQTWKGRRQSRTRGLRGNCAGYQEPQVVPQERRRDDTCD